MKRQGTTPKISFNAPIILCFSGICMIALLLGYLTNHASTNAVFSVYRSSLFDLLTYVRFVGHIFGHASWEHFISNMMLILLVGPLLEEKYGSFSLFIVILTTAIVTGIINYILFPNVQLLGASGVVFAFILLSSLTSFKDGTIPLTFILVTVIYIGKEIYSGIFISDNISNFTHILGGMVGAGFGFLMNKKY